MRIKTKEVNGKGIENKTMEHEIVKRKDCNKIEEITKIIISLEILLSSRELIINFNTDFQFSG